MTSTALPPDKRAALRAALRKNAGRWIAANYRHQILVARAVKSTQADAVAEFQRTVVAPALREIAASLSTFDERGPSVVIDRFPEMRAMANEVTAIVARGSSAVENLTRRKLSEIAQHESDWVADSASRILRVDRPPIVPQQAAQVALERPFLGNKLDTWFRRIVTQPAAENALQWIQTGVSRGLSTDAIVKGLRGTESEGYLDGWLTGSTRDLSTLVRTAGTHYSATANTEAYKAIGIDRYRWVATLDTRSCAACGALDGQEFVIGDGPLPPSPHPNCRCATVPVFGEPEGTRASQDGQVPADLTFREWVEGRSIAEQNEVLGKTRANAWRAGKLDFDKMIGRDLEILTIAELRRLDRLPDEEE